MRNENLSFEDALKMAQKLDYAEADPSADVDDGFNVVLIDGDCTGEVMLYGKGAGKLPTASAVVSDIIYCINNFRASKKACWKDTKCSEHSHDYYFESCKNKYYFKVKKNDAEQTFIAEKIDPKETEKTDIKVISKIMILE